MDIKLTILEDTYRSPQEILEKGEQSQLLRENPIFREAVNSMYNRLTLSEDMILGSSDMDDRQINQKIKHYAMMRCLLTDFITTLDGFAYEAEHVKLQNST